MTRSRAATLAVMVLMVSLGVGSASAQSAAIRGRIVDERGQAVPGATVTLTDPRTGVRRTADSDSEGLYRFAGLPAGVYDIRASHVNNWGDLIDIELHPVVEDVQAGEAAGRVFGK